MTSHASQQDPYQVVFEKAVVLLAAQYRQAVICGFLGSGDLVPCTDEERRRADEAEVAVNEAYCHRYLIDEETGKMIGTAIPLEDFRHLVGVWWRIQEVCLRRVLNGTVKRVVVEGEDKNVPV